MTGVDRAIFFGRGMWRGAAWGLVLGVAASAACIVAMSSRRDVAPVDFDAMGARWLAFWTTRLLPPAVIAGAIAGGTLGYFGRVREAPGKVLRAAAVAALFFAIAAWIYAL